MSSILSRRLNLAGINQLVLVWAFLFVLPPIISYFCHLDLGFRDFQYVGATFTLIWTLWKLYPDPNTSIDIFSINKIFLKLFFLALIFSYTYSFIAKYYAFQLKADDIAIFQTMLNAMLAGNFGYSGAVGFYHFGTHQNYILLLVVPFYWLFHTTETLLIIGAVAIWGTALGIWFLAKLYKLNDFYAFLITISFASSPLAGVDCTFLPELFTPLFLVWMMVFYTKRTFLPFILIVIFALSTKEDAVLFVFGISLVMLYRKDFKFAIVAILASVMVFYINIAWVQPYFVHKSGMLMPTTLQFWSEYGSSKSEIVHNLLLNPKEILLRILNPASGVWRLYLPVLFLPLMIPEVFLASIVTIVMWATSNFDLQHAYKSYYGLNLNVMMFIGVIVLLSNNRLKVIMNKYSRNFYNIFLLFFLLCIIIFPLWGTGWQSFWSFDYSNVDEAKKLAVYMVNNYHDASICSSSTLYQYLSVTSLNMEFFPMSSSATTENLMNYFNRDCIYAITDLGDSYPFSPARIHQFISEKSCSEFAHGFYICLNKN
ncbi:DUF2079 domain-containing protein [Aquella oligotrophica]|uniref:DUF2079 domain-containing protein n=1 Tax=Aquella oligotrophica TaxID=2067065 RepID=UPI001315953D|nr:DUF2079 domain-containing protein [Aquella oligotrophica]